MAVRVTQRPNRLASFFAAARQLVSEVELLYFSSDEDGNLDRLELREGRWKRLVRPYMLSFSDRRT